MRRSLSILLALALGLTTACGKDEKSSKKGPSPAEQALTPENSKKTKAATAASDRQALEEIETSLEDMGVKLQKVAADNVAGPGMNVPANWKTFTRLPKAEQDRIETARGKLTEYLRLAGIYFTRYDDQPDGHYETLVQKAQSAGEAAEFLSNRYLIDDLLETRIKLLDSGITLNYFFSFAGTQRQLLEDSTIPGFLTSDRIPSIRQESQALAYRRDLAKIVDTAKAIQEVGVYSDSDLWDYETFSAHAGSLSSMAKTVLPMAIASSDTKLNKALRQICKLEGLGYVFGEYPHEHQVPASVEDALSGTWSEEDRAVIAAAMNATEDAWYAGDLPTKQLDYRLRAAREITTMLEFRMFAETMMTRNDELRVAGIDLTKSWVSNENKFSNSTETEKEAYLELMQKFQEAYLGVEKLFTDPTINTVTEDYDRERFFANKEDRGFEAFGNLATIVADDLGVSWRKIYSDAFNQAEELSQEFGDE